MLKQLFLMPYIQGHSDALTEQRHWQAKLLANGAMANEIPPHVIVLCAPSPLAKQIAEIIAAKFSMSRRVIPVETTGSLDEYGDDPLREKDHQALHYIEAAMQQNSVVIVVADSLRVEGISGALGQDIRLENAECLVYERQQGLTEKGGPLTFARRLTDNAPNSNVNDALPKSGLPKTFYDFVQNHLSCRGVRIGALVSAATFAALGIMAEVDGRFGLFGVTEIKAVTGQEQFFVHISPPRATNLYSQVKLADQAGRIKKIRELN